MAQKKKTTGTIAGIIANLLTVEVNGPVQQNEICYVERAKNHLMAEVIKVMGKYAYVQVFEDTSGVRVGDQVTFDGHMLEVTLGPGLLQKNFDGLQNDLDLKEGIFLNQGDYTPALDEEKEYEFKPLVKKGEEVTTAIWLGEVKENWIPHKIMVPFTFKGKYTVKEIKSEGKYKLNETIAVLTDQDGDDHEVSMIQKWPVKVANKAYK
ncbi:MAG: V-type ATP synthase subunit A, partial [Bacteroidota bacterium]